MLLSKDGTQGCFFPSQTFSNFRFFFQDRKLLSKIYIIPWRISCKLTVFQIIETAPRAELEDINHIDPHDKANCKLTLCFAKIPELSNYLWHPDTLWSEFDTNNILQTYITLNTSVYLSFLDLFLKGLRIKKPWA